MTTVVTPNEANEALKVVELTQSIHNVSDSSDSETIASDEEDCSECCASCCAASIQNNRDDRIGNYIIERKLYDSEFGKIKLGRHTDSQQKFIIDVIKRRNDTDSPEVNQQIDILRSLKHPNIVKLIDVVQTTRRTGIVLEYALGGDLFEYVLEKNTLNEEIAAKLFAQLISSVKYMHSKGVIHRDLKLENIYFTDIEKTNLIITNFNFANNENKDLLTTNCGSPIYAAPEIIFLEPNGYHGPTADIWSLGVTLFCILCGYLPFDDDEENPNSENTNLLYRYIRTSTLTIPPHVSDQAKDLISAMLQLDTSKRCNMDFITHHSWLKLYHDQLNNVENHTLEEQAQITIDQLKPKDDYINVSQQQQKEHNHHHAHNDHHHQEQQQEQQNDTHSRHILSENENSKEIEQVKSVDDEKVKVETDIEKTKGKEKAIDVVDVDVDENENENENEKLDEKLDEKLPSLQSSSATSSSSASTSNTPISPSTSTTNNNIELDNTYIKDKEINLSSHEQNNKINNNNNDNNNNSTNLNTSFINSTSIKDIPLPPIPNENESIVNDSSITSPQRQPSLRRLKPLKSSKKDSKNNDHATTTITTTAAAAADADADDDDDDHSVAHGIEEDEEKDDIQNCYGITASLLHNENKKTIIDKNGETKDKNNSHNIHQLKSTSSPLLNNQDLKISTTNLNDDHENDADDDDTNNNNDNNNSKNKSRKKRNRTLSDLIFNPNGQRHGRSQSTHLLSSPFSSSPKTPKDQVTVQRNASTSRTIGQDKNNNNNHTVTRNKTLRDSIKSIFKKRRSTSANPEKAPISPPSTSSSSVSTTLEIAAKQHQQQPHLSSEVTSSSTTPLEKPLRVLTSSATRECLTKIPPNLLILSLMRILSALGIKNEVKSYQIVCLRPSDHHNQNITKNTDPSLYNVAPIYGPRSIDKGHHIDFTIEICQSQIQDYYALDFHRSKGDTSAFQFVKAKVLALTDLQSSTV